MKLPHFTYNPSMVRLGNALCKVSMTLAGASLFQENRVITGALLGLGAVGEMMRELYRKTEPEETQNNHHG
jgi:hypothetical protein